MEGEAETAGDGESRVGSVSVDLDNALERGERIDMKQQTKRATFTIEVELEDGDYCKGCPCDIDPIVCGAEYRRYMRPKGRPDSCKVHDEESEEWLALKQLIATSQDWATVERAIKAFDQLRKVKPEEESVRMSLLRRWFEVNTRLF